ncbi:MAG: hypothetical protein M3209_03505 [Acidobacteriota bacterium]|nr:hypothetical protein [Acidobacteriota bacterium]
MLKSSDNLPRFFQRIIVSALLIGAIFFFGGKLLVSNDNLTTTAQAQDLLLERRVSQLEQRFISIDSRIRQIEQNSRLQSITPRTPIENNAEISLLRSQIELLQRRLAEVECGLAGVDERTLSASAREAQRKPGSSTTDPCRLNSNAPVQLSARP